MKLFGLRSARRPATMPSSPSGNPELRCTDRELGPSVGPRTKRHERHAADNPASATACSLNTPVTTSLECSPGMRHSKQDGSSSVSLSPPVGQRFRLEPNIGSTDRRPQAPRCSEVAMSPIRSRKETRRGHIGVRRLRRWAAWAGADKTCTAQSADSVAAEPIR